MLFHVGLRDSTHFVIADLPGYGFAERSKSERDAWAGLIERYLKSRASLAGVVILVDGRRGLQDEEAQLIEYLEHIRRPYFIAVTKVDKLTHAERGKVVAAIRRRVKGEVLGVSGETGEGRDEVLRKIRALVRFDSVPSQGDTPQGAAVDAASDPSDV